MKQMTLEELKTTELDILTDVAEFCDKNGLKYFLAYGTLIGAVRHKGFIPWDDDIDIWMPRDDYNKFLKIYKSKDERYCAISPYDKISRHSMAKVIDTKTVKIEDYIDYKNGYLGVDVDIFPLDGVPDNAETFKKWYKKITSYYSKYTYLVLKPKFGMRSFIFTNLLKIAGVKRSALMDKAQKMHKLYPYESSAYVGAIESKFNSSKNYFLKEWFDDSITVNFEDKQFKIPAHYDEILTQVYGDYMKLPPEDQQVTHHLNNNFWKED